MWDFELFREYHTIERAEILRQQLVDDPALCTNHLLAKLSKIKLVVTTKLVTN